MAPSANQVVGIDDDQRFALMKVCLIHCRAVRMYRNVYLFMQVFTIEILRIAFLLVPFAAVANDFMTL